jgi:hypothetical protein
MTSVSHAFAMSSAAGSVPPATATTAVLPMPIVILFWIWVITSAVILIYRVVRRRSQARTPEDLPVPDPAVPLTAGSTGRSSDPITPVAGPPDRTPLLDAPPASASDPASEPTDDLDSGRSGFFATRPSSSITTDATAATGAARPTVAEALEGIVMPCGLTPVVDGSSAHPNPYRVAFLTTDADGPTVGAAIGDELERLGYVLTTPAATELLARRSGAELRVILYPTPSRATRGLERVFPVVPDKSVGLEFSS